MLEVATVVQGLIQGLILFHRGVQVTEGFIPPSFSLCNRGDGERGAATLRFEILRGGMH
jgi:hypothetical protein